MSVPLSTYTSIAHSGDINRAALCGTGLKSSGSGRIVGAARRSRDVSDPLIVQDNAQERFIDVEAAVCVNEAQSLEFVHEQVDSRPRRADHFR
jgi:hypothetical protein